MRYLVTTKEVYPPFLTMWFDFENHFDTDSEMVVYDLVENKYTEDGETWHKIGIDNL